MCRQGSVWSSKLHRWQGNWLTLRREKGKGKLPCSYFLLFPQIFFKLWWKIWILTILLQFHADNSPHVNLGMPPAQCCSAPSPVLAASPRTRLLSQDSSGRAQTGCLHTSSSCPARKRQWLLCVAKCTHPAKRIHPIFMASTTVCSLRSHWKQEQTSLFLLLLCPTTAIHRQQANLRFESKKLSQKAPNQQLRKGIWQPWVTLCSAATCRCCCVLCPSDQLWSCCKQSGWPS